MEVTHHLLGTEYNTMQTIYSKEFEDLFTNITSEACLSACEKNELCVMEIRSTFRKHLVELGRGSSLYSSELRLEHGNFSTYMGMEKSRWSSSTKSFFRTSCLGMCQLFWKNGLNELYECLCPNPCKHQQQCPTDACTQTGVFEHEYTCACGPGQEWDEDTHDCLQGRFRQLRETKGKNRTQLGTGQCGPDAKCDPGGTKGCAHYVSDKRQQCVCKVQFWGDFCEKPVNACETLIRHQDLPNGGPLIEGNKACNVHFRGNQCYSSISAEGDIYYRCRCNGHVWVPNPGLAYDNCLKKRTVCDSAICVHGECVTSEMGKQAHCLCNPGYEGSSCDRWVGEWSEWSPWDKCRPSCGDVRYSVRTRNCLSLRENFTDQRECLGASIEYARCGEHPCARIEGSYLETYFAVRQDAIAATIATAAITCSVISLTWFFFFSTLVSRVIHGLLAKFKHHIDSRAHYRSRNLSAQF